MLDLVCHGPLQPSSPVTQGSSPASPRRHGRVEETRIVACVVQVFRASKGEIYHGFGGGLILRFKPSSRLLPVSRLAVADSRYPIRPCTRHPWLGCSCARACPVKVPASIPEKLDLAAAVRPWHLHHEWWRGLGVAAAGTKGQDPAQGCWLGRRLRLGLPVACSPRQG